MAAANYGHLDAVKELLSSRAIVQITNKVRFTDLSLNYHALQCPW